MSEAGHGNFRNNGEGGRGRLVDRRGEKLAEEREKERLKWPALVLSFFSGGNKFLTHPQMFSLENIFTSFLTDVGS